MRSQESEVVNFSCWGRCDEPCGEGRPGSGSGGAATHLSPPLPRGSGRRSCSVPPAPPALLPGPVFTAPGAAPARTSCPRLSARSRGGWARPEALVPRPPQAVEVRLKARPWWGAGCALYRASKAPRGGAHLSAPTASGRGGERVLEGPPPQAGGVGRENEASLQTPLGGGASLSTRNLPGGPTPDS